MTRVLVLLAAVALVACPVGTTPGVDGGSGGGAAGGAGGGGGAGGLGGSGGGTAGGGAGGGTGGGSAGSGGAGAIAIAEWTDAPGACPSGSTRVDLSSVTDLEDASRAQGARASDPSDVCYFIHDGVYTQSGSTLPLYILAGGGSASFPRRFVGQSRAGVVIHGRAAIADGVNDVVLTNLTFDLTGYSQSGAFNTLDLGNGSNLTVQSVTFTGDCNTGLQGGHIETNGPTGVLIDSCLIEKFGHCSGGGHLDHGIYLGSGANITITNNLIRQNSSRGIQMYTNSGAYGTLDGITIERNRITANGHADYEDGIVLNGDATGTVHNVTIQNNIIDGNYYSGVRFVSTAYLSIAVTQNTLFHNGAGSSAAGRSELNLDASGSGAQTAITRNIIVAGNAVLNDCYDSAARSFSLADDVVLGTLPSGAAGNCISTPLAVDPQLSNPGAGDFHAQAAAAAGYGAYAP